MERDTPFPEDITSAVRVECDKPVALLICWVNESDHHAHYRNQVVQLRSTFEDIFGSPTMTVYLDAKKFFELQVLFNVSNFAAAHDGPGDLLIVYHAGFIDVGDYRFKKDLNRRKSRDEIVWEE
ncbi:MAG: hypothetical protein L6R38_007084, partial [Xanthoria sp. 2 TBL-2021]